MPNIPKKNRSFMTDAKAMKALALDSEFKELLKQIEAEACRGKQELVINGPIWDTTQKKLYNLGFKMDVYPDYIRITWY